MRKCLKFYTFILKRADNNLMFLSTIINFDVEALELFLFLRETFADPIPLPSYLSYNLFRK